MFSHVSSQGSHNFHYLSKVWYRMQKTIELVFEGVLLPNTLYSRLIHLININRTRNFTISQKKRPNKL